MMTYEAPHLLLIGSASGVVRGQFEKTGEPITDLDVLEQLEAEW